MCSSNSSIRSSAPSSSSSSSRRLRSIVKQQQEKEIDASDTKGMDVRKADNRPREYSNDFEDDFSDSGKSFASSTSSISGKSSSVSPACPAPEQRRKDLSLHSKSPTAIFFRMLFLRCLTTRRKRTDRRNRVLATKILNNGDYQTQEEEGNTNNGNAQRRRSRFIPTNEHEMFFQLHSTSRRSLNAQGLAGSSSHIRSSPTRRYYSASKPSLNTQTLSRSSDHSRTSGVTRRYDNQTRISTVQTDSSPPTVISPSSWSSIEAKEEHYGYHE